MQLGCKPRLGLAVAVAELQSERCELRTWRRPRPACSPPPPPRARAAPAAAPVPRETRHVLQAANKTTRREKSLVFQSIRAPLAGVDKGSAQGRHRRRSSARQLATESTVKSAPPQWTPSSPAGNVEHSQGVIFITLLQLCVCVCFITAGPITKLCAWGNVCVFLLYCSRLKIVGAKIPRISETKIARARGFVRSA